MRRIIPLGVGVLAMLFSGCASGPRTTGALCALIGGAAAGTAGGLIAENNSHDDEATDAGKGAAMGAFAGAVVGYFVCSALAGQEPPPPPPRRAAPTPPPPPPPAVEPLPPPPKPEVKQRIVLRGVNFDFGKDTIRADAAVILEEAARLLNQDPGARVRIEGHTDWIGPDAYNQALSERRAEAVKRFLAGQGVAAERLSSAGYGESRPIASNETKDGRGLNRRVELKVLQ